MDNWCLPANTGRDIFAVVIESGKALKATILEVATMRSIASCVSTRSFFFIFIKSGVLVIGRSANGSVQFITFNTL
ncbi:hypothetical protein CRP01_08735 [Flavilitoribacter nigricans DSM 23189 = NBRC 102662]|uniref:Uncharacterized protein n=1 Tax=Flavilitoribacter nigricans (strain ATCC 23147 / DSM 23189 / NBRC 102662 / NCIMB 1420 / SS-2) TaxID=1122177 RepID=A0A2D0NET9_FLAN2|nr:hypothetical protein CRP01_08735 [Flavilitoribacter nigricans DSM 23189 = NBRC 102662]